MPERIRVFVDGLPLELASGATALDAVRAADPGAADAVVAGACIITDSRGLATDPGGAAFAGAIYRVVRSHPRRTGRDAPGTGGASDADEVDNSSLLH